MAHAPRGRSLSAAHANAAARGFSALAPRYDDEFTYTGLGTILRGRLWYELDRAFGPGDRILDLGCGTGEDAAHLASRGVDVLAIDSAPGMAFAANQKSRRGSSGRFTVACARIEDIGCIVAGDSFDGAIANFGALNCVTDLERLAGDLAGALRPGATLIAAVMGPVCAWEVGWFVLHGRPRSAFRRLRRGGAVARVGGHPIRVAYPGPRSFARTFGRQGFQVRRLEGLGSVLPPTYAASWLEKRPHAMRRLAEWDRALGSLPPSAMVADHYIAVLERAGTDGAEEPGQPSERGSHHR